MSPEQDPLALGLRVGVGQQVPPLVSHTGDAERRRGISIHHQNTSDANIMHGLQIRSDPFLGHATTKPEPIETRAGSRGWSGEAHFEIVGRAPQSPCTRTGIRRRLRERDLNGIRNNLRCSKRTKSHQGRYQESDESHHEASGGGIHSLLFRLHCARGWLEPIGFWGENDRRNQLFNGYADFI